MEYRQRPLQWTILQIKIKVDIKNKIIPINVVFYFWYKKVRCKKYIFSNGNKLCIFVCMVRWKFSNKLYNLEIIITQLYIEQYVLNKEYLCPIISNNMI